ncbi:MAG: VWA domain-containing protein [Methanobacterium sp.]|nr:VWA domain-containing protein [Methanobacterium sp.]
MKNLIFPFSAIVGQENIKKALILNAINPSIGGVLIKGDKGTGKTTAVRALADLLPSIKVVAGCPFNCDPTDESSLCDACKSENMEIEEKKMRVVELPLGSTEDRVVGSINIEKALKEGTKALEPGILAEANRNILYIDEINLLDDNLVDVLLDAAAYGINVVEREGISVSHPSKFILIGTMNPAEGELRPQISDRIGLHIIVHSIMNIEDRVKIMKRREEFERNPSSFIKDFEAAQKEILKNILNARKIIKNVEISEDLLKVIAHICVDMDVDGHRSDIAILKTAKTIAAYNNRLKVDYNDLEEAITLVLGERLPKSCSQDKIKEKLEKAISDTKEDDEKQEEKRDDEQQSESHENGNMNVVPDKKPSEGEKGKKGMMFKSLEEEETPVESDDEGIDIKKLLKMKGKKKSMLYGKRVDSKTLKGKYIKSKLPKNGSRDIAIDATLRAAAVGSKGSIKVENEHLRQKVRKHGARASIAIVVDISGSMFSKKKAAKVKGILNQLMEDTSRHNDKISVIGFKGKEAEVIVPTTKRATSFKEYVDNISVGGTTPLASGIKKGLELLKKEKFKKEYVPMMLILTDGMPNVGIDKDPLKDAIGLAESLKENEINTIVVNFEKSAPFGRDTNMELALASGGRYYDLEDIKDPKAVVSKIIEYEKSNF